MPSGIVRPWQPHWQWWQVMVPASPPEPDRAMAERRRAFVQAVQALRAPRPSPWELEKKFNRLERRLSKLGVIPVRVGSQRS